MPRLALLCTDLCDSTALVESLGDARAAEVSGAHDRVARDLFAFHRGREIDRTDGFLVVFDAAADAVPGATGYHAALRDLGAGLGVPLAARAGVHVADVVLRANPPEDVARGAKPVEVEGIGKPTAARTMSLALPGQTLVTAVAREGLPGELRTTSHGWWRLKGVVAPIELFEAGDDGSPWRPPPDAGKAWRVVQQGDRFLPAREVRHALPAERDAFVGRDADLLALAARVDEGARLVSVLGVGGIGKTRLALRYAWTWLGGWAGGAWFCDLTEARAAAGVASALARAIDVPLGEGDPIDRLGHALAAKGPCLVVLDNFEQVARDADQTLGRWLDLAAAARFVVTTREVLGLPGEAVLVLPPLAWPKGRPSTAAEALRSPAVALLVERARAARRDFVLTDAHAPVIAEIARLLDGMPLAIELAAARLRVLEPAQLLRALSDRFRVLVAAGRRVDRHATLRATLDSSWEPLLDWEKAALAQLSVLAGGFELAAAEDVLDLAAFPDAPWPMDVVQALLDKSLLRDLGAPHGERRFGTWVSVHEYAAERLRTPGAFPGAGPDAEAAAGLRHARHYARLGSVEVGAALRRRDSGPLRARFATELDNLTSACRRATAAGDLEVALACARATRTALSQVGPLAVGVELTTPIVALASGPLRAEALRLHAQALVSAVRVAEAGAVLEERLALSRDGRAAEAEAFADLAAWLGRSGRVHASAEAAEHAVALARAAHAPELESFALVLSVLAGERAGTAPDAEERLRRAIALAREAEDALAEARAVHTLGRFLSQRLRLDEALAELEAMRALAVTTGSREGAATALANIGIVHYRAKRLDPARTALEDGLRIASELGDHEQIATAHANLAMVEAEAGRYRAAARRLGELVATLRRNADPWGLAAGLGNLAYQLAELGRYGEARPLLEEVFALAADAPGDGAFARTEGLAHFNLSVIQAAEGDEVAERASIERSAAKLRAAGDRHLLAVVEAYQGARLHGAGLRDEGWTLLRRATDVLGARDDLTQWADARAVVALLLAREGRLEEAAAAAREAIATLRAGPSPLARGRYGLALAVLVAGAPGEVSPAELEAHWASLEAVPDPLDREGLALARGGPRT